jgi:hypothetical protein
MTFLRNNWHRIVALIVGPAAVMLTSAVALADDGVPW